MRRVTVASLTASGCPVRVYHVDSELPELSRARRGRPLRSRITPLLRFGERDDFTDRIVTGQHGCQPIETKGDAAHRRRAELEGVEQEAEFRSRLLLADTEEIEDPLLYSLLVDTDRATADLLAIEHEVVRLGQDASRVALEALQVFVPRRGERMVHRLPAALVRVPFEERKIDDPENGVAVLRDELVTLGQLDAEAPEERRRRRPLVADEQQEIARRGAQLLDERGPDGVEKFGHRRLQTAVGDLHPYEALGAPALGLRDEVVGLLPAEPAGARNAERLHRVSAANHLGEGLELTAAEQIADVLELEAETQIGLVGAEAIHGLGVGEPGERRWQRHVVHRPQHLGDQALHQRQEIVAVQERRLDVDLGELGLPVLAQIFVAEAANDLEVALEAGHHQELLEE